MSFFNEKKLIENYWHLGCHESELPRHGDYLKLKLGEYDIVLFNDLGNIICFDNICPHRGASIFNSDFGNSPLYCKYHGWSYSNGSVVIPEPEKYINCSRRDLNKFSTEYCGSYIFFCISPRQSLNEQLTPSLFNLIENISFYAGKRLDFNNYEFECYWPIAIENALEPDHLPFIHPDTLAKLKLSNCTNSFYGNNSKVSFCISDISLEGKIKKVSKLFSISEDVHKGYMSIHLFPFGFISSTYGLSYSIQNFFPLTGVEKTYFLSRLYMGPVKEGYVESLLSFFESTVNMNHKVFDEDHQICKLITKKSWLSSKVENLSTEEIKINHFREAIFINGIES